MAKIHGIEVKNVRCYEGAEGFAYQGEMYLNGKKIGRWSQDGWGGEDNFDFEDSEISYRKFNDLIRKTCPSFEFMGSKVERDLPILMEDLVNLNRIEKDQRKYAKKGTPFMVLADFVELGEYKEYAFPDKYELYDVLEVVKREVEKSPRYCDQKVKYYWFKDSEAFEIGEPFNLKDVKEVA